MRAALALATVAAALLAAAPAWAAFPGTNGLIAFSRDDAGGDYDLWAMKPDGSGKRALTTSPRSDSDPAWAPGGRRVAFARDVRGNFEVFVKNVRTGTTRRLTHRAGYDIDPAWAPDGRRIVFASARTGNFELFVFDLRTGRATRIPGGSEDDFFPAWSPDGSKIAWAGEVPGGGLDIFVRDLESDDVIDVTPSARYDDEAPNWSPDGTRLAFARSDRRGLESAEIYVKPAGLGVPATRLTHNAAQDVSPAWSPDGRFIAYQRSVGDVTQVWRMRANGTHKTSLTAKRYGSLAPDWQPRP